MELKVYFQGVSLYLKLQPYTRSMGTWAAYSYTGNIPSFAHTCHSKAGLFHATFPECNMVQPLPCFPHTFPKPCPSVSPDNFAALLTVQWATGFTMKFGLYAWEPDGSKDRWGGRSMRAKVLRKPYSQCCLG